MAFLILQKVLIKIKYRSEAVWMLLELDATCCYYMVVKNKYPTNTHNPLNFVTFSIAILFCMTG